MNPTFMSIFVRELIRAGLARRSEISGCSRREISKLEKHFAFELPQIYKEFLLTMGNGAGGFYRGTDCFYPSLFELREWFEELLLEDQSAFRLTGDAFVFSSHQGVIFHFFYTIDNKIDPAVWGYCEGYGSPKKIYESFSAFMSESLDDFKRIGFLSADA